VVMVFHLVAERPFATTGDQEMSLDVVMVRPSADSGWLVHDKGRWRPCDDCGLLV